MTRATSHPVRQNISLHLAADPTNTLLAASGSTRDARIFPEEAVLHCRAGFEAMKGNQPENAAISFRQALALNPMLWEAFEGLCSSGM